MIFSKKTMLFLLLITIFLVGCSKNTLIDSLTLRSSGYSSSRGWTVGYNKNQRSMTDGSVGQVNIRCPVSSFSGFTEAVGKIPNANIGIYLDTKCSSSNAEYLQALKVLVNRTDEYQSWWFFSDSPKEDRMASGEELEILKDAKVQTIGLAQGFGKGYYDENIAKILRSGKLAKYWEPMGILYSEKETKQCWATIPEKQGNNFSSEEINEVNDCFKKLDEK